MEPKNKKWIIGLMSSTVMLSSHLTIQPSAEETVADPSGEDLFVSENVATDAVNETAAEVPVAEETIEVDSTEVADSVESASAEGETPVDGTTDTVVEPAEEAKVPAEDAAEEAEEAEVPTEDAAEETLTEDAVTETPTAEEDTIAEDFTLRILHTNDIHASIDDFANISYFLNEQRSEVDHSLYLDAGDIFSGNPVVDLNYGVPMIELLNEMNLDLMTIGNHEFDYGQEELQKRRNESEFKWLSANTEVVDPSIPIQPVDPYEIFEFGDVTVGVLGITQNPPASNPSGLVGLEFNPYVETALEYSYLRDQVDIFIALTHIGYPDDVRLAEEVDFFDVIIGAHSHTTLDELDIVNGTPIAQTGSNGRNVGVIDISLVDGFVAVNGYLQSVEELADDDINSTVQAMIDGYNAESEELLSQVLGHTNTGLDRDDRWQKDVALGNMITDALRNFANTDIAITNNGGIRASIEPGDITAGDIFTVDPFGNGVSIIKMTGHDIKDIIAYSFHRSLDSYGPQIDLQTSGMTYIVYTDENGHFADADLFVNGEAMDLDATYTIATNSFIVDGGDGYDFSKATIIQADAGVVTNALIQFIENKAAAGESVDYEPTEGRILTLPITEREAGEDVPGENVPGEEIPDEEPGEGENVPGEEVTEDVPGENAPDEEAQTEDGEVANMPAAAEAIDETSDELTDEEIAAIVAKEEAKEDAKQNTSEQLPHTATSAWALGLIGLVTTTAGVGIKKERK